MVPAFLSIRSPDMNQKVSLGTTPVTIGRATENTIVLTDVQASRYHCVIGRSGDEFSVRDLDSRNGTLVNGAPVKTAQLHAGDTISVGATTIQLEISSERPKGSGAKRLGPKKNTVIPPPPPRPAPGEKPAAAPPPAAKAPAKNSKMRTRPRPAQFSEDLSLHFKDEEVEELVQLTPIPSDEIGLEEQKAPEPPQPAPAEAKEAQDEADGADLLASISLASQDPTVDFGVSSAAGDDERFLPVLAESLPNKMFGTDEISLVNQRGQVIHPAIRSNGRSTPATHVISDAVAVFRQILVICCRSRATDIHVEPKNEDFQLRLRIDGNMVDIVRLTKTIGTKVCSMVKVLCEIDLQFRNIIQEGHFASIVPNRRIDYRVSFIPAVQGQKLVVRVLDAANGPQHLGELHLPAWMAAEIKQTSEADSGMILVVGPTGSGKTTTLYATLRDVGVERRNVVTIEDPVEIELPGITQVPVNEGQGNTFPSLLRSMLRQDPDVIMVGEIRDAETAGIAMQAAMTGHMVLSTLHARDTVGTIFRLLDLGVERYLVASGLQIIVAQRLVRQLCPLCKRAVAPTPEQSQRLGKRGRAIEKAYVPVGCPACLKTGFFGRRAIFEMITANDELREVMMKNPSPKEIQRALSGTRFASLADTGYQLVAQGITSLDEIEKAVGR